MSNQFAANKVLNDAAEEAFGSDAESKRNFKRKIYKRLGRRGSTVETASKEDWAFVFDDENYPEHLRVSKQVKVGGTVYQSIGQACRALNKPEYERDANQFEGTMRKRLRRAEKGRGTPLTPTEKGNIISEPVTKSLTEVEYQGVKYRSFSAACKALGRNRQKEWKRYQIVLSRVDMTAGEYFGLSEQEYEEMKELAVIVEG